MVESLEESLSVGAALLEHAVRPDGDEPDDEAEDVKPSGNADHLGLASCHEGDPVDCEQRHQRGEGERFEAE